MSTTAEPATTGQAARVIPDLLYSADEQDLRDAVRSLLAERVLGLPKEARVDTGPWKDLPR